MAKPSVSEVARIALDECVEGLFHERERTPYVLHRAEDYFQNDPSKVGQFLLVNRCYDPISSTIPGNDPRVLNLRKLAVQRSLEGSLNLYDDGCVPHSPKEDLKDYQERLKVLL